MYNILRSIFWHLAYDMTVSKDELYNLVYSDTNCRPEEFDIVYNQVTEAYIK